VTEAGNRRFTGEGIDLQVGDLAPLRAAAFGATIRLLEI
jgi:hypothetical protein